MYLLYHKIFSLSRTFFIFYFLTLQGTCFSTPLPFHVLGKSEGLFFSFPYLVNTLYQKFLPLSRTFFIFFHKHGADACYLLFLLTPKETDR